jgi:tRNA G10  N-methylase Trm11
VLEKGVDICFIRGDKALYVGKTVGIQDLDAYTLRDYEKPCRDAKVGMLPPKLAQVMINMTVEGNRKKALTIYDPFCGTGTLLIEGLLMGFNAIGSDIDERMCEYSEKNCKWAEEQFKTSNTFRVFKKDAQTLNKPDLPEKVDAIITEGFLGNPMTRIPHPKEQQYIFDGIAELTFNWLRAVRDITPQNLKVTLCLPAFKFGPKVMHLPEFERLAKEVGFKIVKSFTYDRPEQIVARDIKVMEKL